MKIGDIIRRKDLPILQYKIVGEYRELEIWVAQIIKTPKFKALKTGLIKKEDTRWEVVE